MARQITFYYQLYFRYELFFPIPATLRFSRQTSCFSTPTLFFRHQLFFSDTNFFPTPIIFRHQLFSKPTFFVDTNLSSSLSRQPNRNQYVRCLGLYVIKRILRILSPYPPSLRGPFNKRLER